MDKNDRDSQLDKKYTIWCMVFDGLIKEDCRYDVAIDCSQCKVNMHELGYNNLYVLTEHVTVVID